MFWQAANGKKSGNLKNFLVYNYETCYYFYRAGKFLRFARRFRAQLTRRTTIKATTAAAGKQQVFGYQLLLDLYGCKEGVCDDLGLCYQFLDDIVTALGMEKQSPPSIFRSDATRFPDKAGLSGWAPLIESSIVIHTLTPKNYISIDVYCCKCFSVEKAKELCRKFFAPKKVDEQFIERGMDYFKAESNYSTVTVKHGQVAVAKKDAALALK